MMDHPSESKHANPKIREEFNKAFALLEKDNMNSDALAILKRNISEECTSSMVLLGLIYSNGNETEREESIELFHKAAKLGDNSGMRNMGYCYALGINVEKNKEKGAEWYTRAAEAGNAKAMCNIGVMYSYGNGVPVDLNKAFEWFTKSSQGGYPRGMTNLGEFYLYGKGTEKNVDAAEEWFKKSGSPRSLYRLAEVYSRERNDKDTGMKYLRESA